MKKLTFGPIFVIAALLLSSCQFHTGLGSLFSGKSSSSTTATKEVKATHTPPSPGASSGTQTVSTPAPGAQIIIASTGAQPTTLQVKVGTTITVTNQDSVAHTLVYLNNHSAIAPGVTVSFSLNTAGTITYYLDNASSVKYTVVVTP
jgi:plastocyanin